MGGILMGAFGGAGEALQQIGAANQKADLMRENEMAINQQKADIDTQKAMTLEKFKSGLAVQTDDAMRVARTGRINNAASGLAEAQKRGVVQTGITDTENWTPDQQAAVDQSISLDKQVPVTDQKIREQAAVLTGDIDPKTAATLNQQSELSQMRNETALKDIMAKIDNAKTKAETAQAIAELRVLIGAGNKPPAGYRQKSDGSGDLEAIPGGPADGKPLTDTQSKALLFGSRMKAADEILNKLAEEGTTTSVPGSRTPGIGSLISSLSSENKQMLDQAKRDFMTAVLRRESGAAISNGEFETADKQYFPQIGDSEKVIAQKAANRDMAIRGVLAEVPEKQRATLLPERPGKQAGSKRETTSDVSSIEAEMARRGLLK